MHAFTQFFTSAHACTQFFPSAAGTALSIQYCPANLCTNKRRTYLCAAYGFICSCPGCTVLPDFSRCFLCPYMDTGKCKNGIVVPMREGETAKDWRCMMCKRETEASEWKAWVKVEEKMEKKLAIRAKVIASKNAAINQIISTITTAPATSLIDKDNNVESGETDQQHLEEQKSQVGMKQVRNQEEDLTEEEASILAMSEEDFESGLNKLGHASGLHRSHTLMPNAHFYRLCAADFEEEKKKV